MASNNTVIILFLAALTLSTADIFPLTDDGAILFDRNNYFLIRLDKLKKNQ